MVCYAVKIYFLASCNFAFNSQLSYKFCLLHNTDSQVVRMVVSTYQAASGAGAAAMEELELQTREVLTYCVFYLGFVSSSTCDLILIFPCIYVEGFGRETTNL